MSMRYTPTMSSNRRRLAVAGALLSFVSLALLAWAYWPIPRHVEENALGSLALEGPPGLPSISIDAVTITLEHPRWLRVGDTQTIRLRFSADGVWGLSPQAETTLASSGSPGGNQDASSQPRYIILGSLHATAGSLLSPSQIAEPYFPEHVPTMSWHISAPWAGEHNIAMGLKMRQASEDSSPEVEQVLWGRNLDLPARSTFGLAASTARWLAFLGTVGGALFTLPYVKEIYL